MAILTSALLIRSHALTLLTLSYYLITSPSTILSSSALTLLGQSMRLPPAAFQPYRNTLTQNYSVVTPATHELCGLLGLVLGVMALGELLWAGGLGVGETLRYEEGSQSGFGVKRVSRERKGEDLAVLSAAQGSWMGQAVLRVALEGLLCIWSYLVWGDRDLLGLSDGKSRNRGATGDGSLKMVLGNQVVFTLALLDMLFWGWVWTVIREERREVLRGVQQWREEGGGEERDD
jgi:hypothetical protein